MFQIKNNSGNSKSNNYIDIENQKKTASARIYLDMGASLQELVLDNKTIIEDLKPLTYNNTYASSILFPFANRIKDGEYIYNNTVYNLEINESGNHNALHGLVYNKPFKITEKLENETFASVKLIYNEENESVGFPYKYSMQLEYVLTELTLDLHVTVKNTDNKAFPFTLGWHPYFLSKNLYNSSLVFDSETEITFDNRCITTGTKNFNEGTHFEIKDKQLDNCFILKSNDITFKTPDYNLLMSASSKESFLQIYTPPKENIIAIEPTTGVSNSFNNGMGLQILEPNNTYQLNWNIKLI